MDNKIDDELLNDFSCNSLYQQLLDKNVAGKTNKVIRQHNILNNSRFEPSLKNIMSENNILDEQIKISDITKSDYYHNGYIEYLLCAWKNHLSVEVAPWHYWTIILWNLKEFHKQQPKRFEYYWSNYSNNDNSNNNNNKYCIKLDNTIFDVVQLIDEIKNNIPSDTFNSVYLDFTNAPNGYKECLYGLIGSVVNIYYDIFIYACGIPNVRVKGTIDEWLLLREQCDKLIKIFKPIADYITNVSKYIDECIINIMNDQYWKNMFKIDKCGSSHQKIISGHILNLFNNKEFTLDCVPRISSKIKFNMVSMDENINEGCFMSGIFTSTIDNNNFLVPSYNTIITKYEYVSNQIIINDLTNAFNFLHLCSVNKHKTLINERYVNTDFIDIYNNINFPLNNNDEEKKYISTYDNKNNIDLKNIMIGYNALTALYNYIDIVNKNINDDTNFWMKSWNYYKTDSYKINIPIVTTESWLYGLKEQKDKQYDKLLIDNMHHIIEEFLSNNQILSYCEKNKNYCSSIHLLDNVILSTYNVKIYECYFDNFYDYIKEKNLSENTFYYAINDFMYSLCMNVFDKYINISSIDINHSIRDLYITYHSSFMTNYLIKQMIEYWHTLKFIDYIEINSVFNVQIDDIINRCIKETLKAYNSLYFTFDNIKSDSSLAILNIYNNFNKFYDDKYDALNIFKEKLKQKKSYIDTTNDTTNDKSNLIKILDFLKHCNGNVGSDSVHTSYLYSSSYDNYYSIWMKDCFYDYEKNKNLWCVTYENYMKKKYEFNDMYKLIYNNIDELYSFMKKSDNNGLIMDSLFWTLNTDILIMIIKKYEYDPYLVKSVLNLDNFDETDRQISDDINVAFLEKFNVEEIQKLLKLEDYNSLKRLLQFFSPNDFIEPYKTDTTKSKLNNIKIIIDTTKTYNLIVLLFKKLHMHENQTNPSYNNKFDCKIFQNIFDDLLNDEFIKNMLPKIYYFIFDYIIPKIIEHNFQPDKGGKFVAYNVPLYRKYITNPNFNNAYGIYISMLHRIGRFINIDFDIPKLKKLAYDLTNNALEINYPSDINTLVLNIWS
jgi:hypothetical protein